MAGDGVELALGARFAEALRIYGQGLDVAEIVRVAGFDATTLGRWGRSGRINMAAVLRLNEFFAARGRAGFLDAVTGVPGLAYAAWRARACGLDQVEDDTHRMLIAASEQIGANPRELLERCGLLADSHIILLRDTDAISIHIGSRTVVSPDLFGRDIRDRKNKSYAGLVYDHVTAARAGTVMHALQDDQGNGYRSLRLRFRAGPSAPLEIVTLPHAIVSATNYLVR